MLTIENTSRRRVRDYESERRASSKKGRRKINFSLLNIGKGIDIPFVLLIFVLLAIGITMMFSASYPVAYYEIGDSYYYLKRQLIFALIGLVVMIAVSFVDYHYYHRFAAIILGISYFALVLVLVLPSQEGGVHRWIGVGMFGIQASEISKFAIILFMAHWGSRYYDRMDTLKYGVLPGAAVFLSTAFLLLFEPHYSCIVIIGILTVVMMYVSGIKIKWLAIGAAVLAVLILLLWVTGMLTYAMERMDGWGQALSDDLDRDMWNSTWQTRNSLYAIGSGGLFGLGLGQSRQKYLYPERLYLCYRLRGTRARRRGADIADICPARLARHHHFPARARPFRQTARYRSDDAYRTTGRTEYIGNHRLAAQYGYLPAVLQLRRFLAADA